MEQSTRPFQYLECRTDLPEDLRQWILAKLDGIHELIEGERNNERTEEKGNTSSRRPGNNAS